MKTSEFWNLINTSIEQKNSLDKNEQGDALLEILVKSNVQQILDFHNTLTALKKDLETPEFNDIAFMMKYGDNKTALSGFKNWVVALGEEHYRKAKQSPAHLLTLDDHNLFVAGRPYLNEIDLVASVAYDQVSKEQDPEWYVLVQKHRRLQQLNKNQEQDNELEP